VIPSLTVNRFKNYEAAYNRRLAIEDKDYGSLHSATQSTASIIRGRPGDSVASIEQHDNEDDDGDSEAGMSSLPLSIAYLLTPP
jgi:hypothetical protein